MDKAIEYQEEEIQHNQTELENTFHEEPAVKGVGVKTIKNRQLQKESKKRKRESKNRNTEVYKKARKKVVKNKSTKKVEEEDESSDEYLVEKYFPKNTKILRSKYKEKKA